MLLTPALAWASDGSNASQFGHYYEKYGAVVAVLASFGFGIVASLTPCVYPMVPITVSIFGATEAKSRLRGAGLSLAFVLGIACLFTPLGLVSAFTGKLMGSQLANAWVVVGLALLFTALAASMFGAFELALPSRLTNRLSTVGGLGFKGAFAMGLVMGLIAAPCTGPFLTGLLVFVGQKHDPLLGSAALFSFSLGLGVLFFVAGTFAISLPKGGAWMMGIKWVSGVGLAYMAFGYLRDRFDWAHRLVRHDSAFAIVTGGVFAAGIVLGAVHVIAERRKSRIARLSKPTKLASIPLAVAGAALFVSWIVVPPPIAWMESERDGRAKAASEHKPTIIDFGARWCEGCRDFESKTFPNAEVQAQLKRFVAIHVACDDDEDPEIVRLQAKYGVRGLPTVIVLDEDGAEIKRFNKFAPATVLLPVLESVRITSPSSSPPPG